MKRGAEAHLEARLAVYDVDRGGPRGFQVALWDKRKSSCVSLALAFSLRYDSDVTNVGLLKVLETESPEDVEHWCRESLPDEARVLSDLVPKALSGSRVAAFGYVKQWRSLANSFLLTVHDELPDLVSESEGRQLVVGAEDKAASILRFLLEAEALEAPFSSWVARADDVGIGSCAALIQKLRSTIPELRPVDLDVRERPDWDVSQSQLRSFRKNVLAALNRDEPALNRIREVFELTVTELGSLFGVTRQAAAQWLELGVPTERQAKVATVASIADLLENHLRPGRVPGIVRRPAQSYSGLTALEMIKQDRHEELLHLVRESFDWARPA